MKKTHIFRFILPMFCLLILLICAPAARAEEADTEGAYAAIVDIYDQVIAGDVFVDLEAYGITVDQLDELVSRSSREGLKPWYLDTYTYSYRKETMIVTSVTFKRVDSAEYDFNLYEQKVAEILIETVKPGMSQWQIALVLHDYLVVNCAYDETYTYYSGYDAIVRGTAVCNGYALAYMDLLHRAGIEARKVTSEAMNHAWNLVKIGENWLHVDVTWDDPVSDRQGRVLHQYFLISDSAISDENHNHYDWDGDIACTFTEWDTNRFWHDIDSQIVFESRDLCYLRDKTGETTYTIYSRDSETGDLKKIVASDAGYIDIGGSKTNSFFYGHNGLSYDEGKLYYSDMTKVYSISPDGSGKKTVYSHNYKDNKTYIAGSFVSDGVLYMTLSDHDGNLTDMQIALGTPSHTHTYTASEYVMPDCTECGYSYFICDCGCGYKGDFTAAIGHIYDEGITVREATENSSGILRRTCSVCGAIHDTDIFYTGLPTATENTGNDPAAEDPAADEKPSAQSIAIGAAVLFVLWRLFRKKKK